MADKKISQLPATASVNSDDTFEKSLHNAAPSERVTAAQLATFMQTAMALVQLSGGNIKLNADGSASFAGVKILFNADGSCTFASANAGFASDGALNLPLSHLLADGSAQFANGKTVLLANGSATFANGDIQALSGGSMVVGSTTANGIIDVVAVGGTPTIQLNGVDGSATFGNSFFDANSSLNLGGGPSATISALDGSASFANGNASISATGALGSGGNGQDGSINLSDSVGNGTVSISGLDGIATFAAAQVQIAADGSIDTATAYKCQAIQVVGPQQPAIADATNAVDVITQFNTLLAELRTHGLIST